MGSGLNEFCEVYEGDLLGKDWSIFESVYTQDVHFIDPLHEIQGREALLYYFKRSTQNLIRCDFVITNAYMGVGAGSDEGLVEWVMAYQSPRLRSGKLLHLPGCSALKFRDSKVCRHRDYFDLGNMVYEHLPLMGHVVGKLKNRLAS